MINCFFYYFGLDVGFQFKTQEMIIIRLYVVSGRWFETNLRERILNWFYRTYNRKANKFQSTWYKQTNKRIKWSLICYCFLFSFSKWINNTEKNRLTAKQIFAYSLNWQKVLVLVYHRIKQTEHEWHMLKVCERDKRMRIHSWKGIPNVMYWNCMRKSLNAFILCVVDFNKVKNLTFNFIFSSLNRSSCDLFSFYAVFRFRVVCVWFLLAILVFCFFFGVSFDEMPRNLRHLRQCERI